MHYNQFPTPLTLEQTRWIADYAKTIGKEEAVHISKMLNVMCRGENAPDKWKEIDSIDSYYEKDIKRKALEDVEKLVDERLNQILSPASVDDDEEKIVKAIEQTVNSKLFSSSRDWGGIYIILTSRCKWKKSYKEFERKYNRLAEMYPQLKKLPKNKNFNYQSLQQGIDREWPDTYWGWKTSDNNDETFIHRRQVAEEFWKNLNKGISIKQTIN